MENKAPWIVTAIALLLGGLLSFSFFSAKQNEQALRLQKEVELTAKVEELSRKETELAEALKEKKGIEDRLGKNTELLEATVKKYDEKIQALTEETRELQKEIGSLQNEKTQKDKKIQELMTKVQALEADKFDLIKKLKGDSPKNPPEPAADKPEVVKLGELLIQKPPQAVAEVVQVNKTYGFLVLSAGSKSGLTKDSVLTIFRGKKLIGKAIIEQTKEDVSAALILPEWTREDVQIGDSVAKA
ncbi:MAG: hypothetical protein HYZ87_00890 [Candidatus Omnitrophica bacterium]|nr:hypothetical protein [Candidatus Omnitrophota bacterium]